MASFDEFPHWAIKLIALVALFLLSMIFGAIPLKLSRDLSSQNTRRSRLRNLLISLSNCFAGGVFFSTVILDLFPEVKDTITEALAEVEIETKFPLSDFIIGFGFIMMLIIEQFVHSCCSNSWLSHHGHEHEQKVNINDDEFAHIYDHEADRQNERSPLLNENTNDTIESKVKKQVSVGPTEILHGNSISYSDDDNEIENILEQSQQSNVTSASYDTFYSQHGTHHRVRRLQRTKSLASMQSQTHSNFRTFVLVFAISLHSLFEGLAVGVVVKTNVLLQLVVALLIHKSIIAFSIGVQLVDADLPSSTVLICLGIFGIMCPIGIGIGLAVLHTFSTVVRLFFSGVLQGIATGTFLYVTFFEVLPHELNIEDDKKPLKILFVLLGYITITGICYYENGFKKMSNIHPA